MPAPLVGGLLWGIGALLGLLVTRIYDMFFRFFAEKIAFRITVGTAYVIAASALTVSMALAVKAMVLYARYSMPSSLGASTYFLPSNINIILGIYVTMRLTYFVWSWTLKNMERWFQP